MKIHIKIISIILTVLIISGVFSTATPVLAAELNESEISQETEISEEAAISDELSESSENETAEETEGVEIIGEDESRRDETTKHFILSNGSRRAVKYSQPVHFEKGGEWVDIDNTLEFDEESESFKNKSNSFKASFGKEIESERLFEIENDGYTLSWVYKNSPFRRKSIIANVPQKETGHHGRLAKHTEKVTSEIEYADFENDCTLEYVLTGNGVKENIILKNSRCKNEFTFEVTAEGLRLEKNTDGSISVFVKDSGEEKFYIPAPFMVDSANEYSEEVEYSVEERNGKYLITVSASEEWLKDKSRVYPVTIDPVIQTRREKSAISITFVASGNPSANYDDMQDVYIGVESTNYEKCRALVKFALPELNSGDMVIGATMGLWLHSVSYYTSSMPEKQINAHVITGSWSASSVTWNTMPSYNSNVSDYAFIEKSVSAGTIKEIPFDVTRAVKEWYEGSTNYGLMIKSDVESGSDAEVAARGIFWSDKYNGQDDLYPYISIDYRNNKGLEGMWSYTQFGVSGVGVAHINDYTGNMVYEAPLMSSISEVLPLSLTGYFNGYEKGENVAAKSPSGTNVVKTTIGQGWRLNVQQTLLPSSQYGLTGDAAEKYPYVYTDADGTEHYIQKVTEDEKTVYKDEDGLGLTLVRNEEYQGTSYAYTLKEKSGGRMTFNVNGNLTNIFDSYGNYIRVIYKAANAETGLPEKSRISSVVDGSGHKFTFSYRHNKQGVENSFVDEITDSAGRTVKFTHDPSTVDSAIYNLTKITYADGTFATFTYDGYKLTSAKNNLGNKYNFAYTPAALGSRVKAAREYDADGASGRYTSFDRSKYNITVIRSAGLDGIHNNDDDILTTLYFDNAGRTVSQQLKYGSGSSIGAGAYTYSSSVGDTSTKGSKNKVTSTASLSKNVPNLLFCGNGESLSKWNEAVNGSIVTDNAVSSQEIYVGTGSIKLKTTSSSVAGTNYMYQNVSGVSADNSYTLSAYVKATELVATGDGVKGAYLQLRAYNSSGEAIEGATYKSAYIDADTDASVNNGWERLSVTLPKTTGIVTLRAFICFKNMKGKVYFDCIQLEKGSVVNDYNMLENGSFEKYSSGLPSSWSTENITYTVNDGFVHEGISDYTDAEGSYSIRVVGKATTDKKIYQTVNVEGNKKDTYILSGWAGGNPVPNGYHYKQTKGQGTDSTEDDEFTETALFELCPKVTYKKTDADGDTETVSQYKPSAKFNKSVTGWQFSATAFSLKYTGGESGCTYEPQKITVILRYYKQANGVYFDNIMLTKEPVPTYTYDKDGNPVSASANSSQSINAEFDDDTGNLLSYTDTCGNKTKINYNDQNSPTLTESAKGVFSTTRYKDNGLPDISHTRNNKVADEASMIIKTERTYFDDSSSTAVDESKFVQKVYDAHGTAAETYTYDFNSGVVNTITDANGIVTDKNYNTNKTRLLSVTTGNSDKSSKVSYGYDSGGRLNKIVFGKDTATETYTFTYDEWGNTKKTKVGGKTLSENTYLENNGALSETTYGNDDTVSYSYNNLGLASKIIKTNYMSEGGPVTSEYRWSYSTDGTPLTHVDASNGRRYLYNYDSLGRLVSQDILSTTDDSRVGFLERGYDLRNNVNMLNFSFGGRSFSQIYSYSERSENASSASYTKDNLPTLYKISSDRYATYSYDSLNRLTGRDFKISETKNLHTNYKYALSNRNNGDETKYRTTQLYREFIADDVYIYTYDAVGNITGIRKGERKQSGSSAAEVKDGSSAAYRSYEYDALGQLTRENNVSANESYVYAYDSRGNIGSKTVYSYSTAGTLTGATTKKIDIVYSAENETGWNKLPTSVVTYVNGSETSTENISYDEIGNPTTYRGAELVWNGRQLYMFKKEDKKEYYYYNADGLRVRTKHYEKSSGSFSQVAVTRYEYSGDKLIYQARENFASGDMEKELYFFYDSYGNLSYIKYYKNNGAQNGSYIVLTNSRGDVTSLYDTAGNLAVSYEYDAWGNTVSTNMYRDGVQVTETNDPDHIGIVNPIRYRGYYYNTATKLYYLQSRFYDAEIGRFINADGYITTGQGVLSYNMFAYCQNNPVMFSDPSGEITLLTIFCCILVASATIVGTVSAVKGGYFIPKASEAFNDVASNAAKTSAVKTTGNIGSKFLGGLGAALSILNSGQAINNKMQSIENFTKDSYNYAYYNNRGINYSVLESKCEIFSSNEYNDICRNNIALYSQEFDIAPAQYTDLGVVPWDELSSDSQAYMLGRFNSINGDLELTISRYYAGEGAITP